MDGRTGRRWERREGRREGRQNARACADVDLTACPRRMIFETEDAGWRRVRPSKMGASARSSRLHWQKADEGAPEEEEMKEEEEKKRKKKKEKVGEEEGRGAGVMICSSSHSLPYTYSYSVRRSSFRILLTKLLRFAACQKSDDEKGISSMPFSIPWARHDSDNNDQHLSRPRRNRPSFLQDEDETPRVGFAAHGCCWWLTRYGVLRVEVAPSPPSKRQQEPEHPGPCTPWRLSTPTRSPP